MREFSEEDIQRAADEVKQGDFWDFMFRDPGQNRGTTRKRTSRSKTSGRLMTSRRNTSRRNTSRNHNTSRRNTSRRNTSKRKTSRCCCHDSKWRNSSRGNYQMKCCWKDGNMWSLRIRKRK
jgi:hypothetical protein